MDRTRGGDIHWQISLTYTHTPSTYMYTLSHTHIHIHNISLSHPSPPLACSRHIHTHIHTCAKIHAHTHTLYCTDCDTIDIILRGLETAHIRTYKTARNPRCTFEREQQANHVGLQAHSRRHESSRVILLSSYYLQVVVEVCHQLLVSPLADIPAVGSENWQNSAFPVFVGLYMVR